MGKQKINCKIFTPQNVVISMMDMLGYKENLYGQKILENSCGDGRFLEEIVKRYIDDCRRRGYTEDEMLDLLMEQGADIKDIEADEDRIVITGDAKEYNNIKKALLAINPNMEFEVDEVSMVSLDKVKLEGEDLEMFNKLLNMLDEIEDVQNVYHNVEL